MAGKFNLEGCAESPKQKCALEYYIFNIWLWGDENYTNDKKIIRKIRIAGTKSLYNFAKVITQAFGFEFDHCFGFYDTLRDRKNCKKAFELFVDIQLSSEKDMVLWELKTIGQANK